MSFWDYCGIFDFVLLIISRLLHQAGVFCLSGTIVGIFECASGPEHDLRSAGHEYVL